MPPVQDNWVHTTSDYYIGEPSSLTNTDLVNRSFAMPVRCVKIK